MSRRSFNSEESAIVNKLLTPNFTGVDKLRAQVKDIEVQSTGDSDEYGSLYLYPQKRVPAETVSQVPVEGLWIDADDTPVYCLLHVRDGLLHELEFFKADGSKIVRHYDVDRMKVIVRK